MVMCGIAGWMGPNAYPHVYRLLLELQHRGHDAAGVALHTSRGLVAFGGGGFVWNALPSPDNFNPTVGAAVGHVRYSTSGAYSGLFQPVISARGLLALAFNGNIVNHVEASREILGRSYEWDAAALADMAEELYLDTGDIVEALRSLAELVVGSYSMVVLTSRGELVAARDPHGIRPLAYHHGDGVVAVASETAALQALGLEWRELPRSTILYCPDPHDCSVESLAPPLKPLPCAFEYIYFLRPDSIFEGVNAHAARVRMGEQLAEMDSVEADLVVPVPDSGRSAALGYARRRSLPLEEALYRNRFAGRAFISAPSLRGERLRSKFSVIPGVVEGRRVVVVDDSVVRGDTSRHIVSLLRRAGAREVHVRIAAPPVRYPCFYGIDMPSRGELIAWRLGSLDTIAASIGADSILYNTVDNIVKAVGHSLCLACFTGAYPHKFSLQLMEERFTHGRGR